MDDGVIYQLEKLRTFSYKITLIINDLLNGIEMNEEFVEKIDIFELLDKKRKSIIKETDKVTPIPCGHPASDAS